MPDGRINNALGNQVAVTANLITVPWCRYRRAFDAYEVGSVGASDETAETIDPIPWRFRRMQRCGARKLRDSKKQMEDILKRVSELEKKSR